MEKRNKEKNYEDVMKMKRELELREYEKERTGCCPLCKREASEKIESYVRKEIAKSARDPDYVPVVYNKGEKH